MSDADLPLSIVLCTHRRAELLAGVVRSLTEQDVASSRFEVLVVDNDHQPNAEVQAIVERHRPDMDIRYLHETNIGLSHARNSGGKAARSDYIAYLDDDVRVPSGYLAVILRDLGEYAPDICGGPYFPFYLDSKPVWFRDAYGTSSRGSGVRFLSDNEFLDGGNIVFQRKVLEEAGWFDAAYGMSGNRVWYGEETAVQMRARQENPDIGILYDSKAYVLHLVAARKMRVGFQLWMAYQLGRSQTYLWLPEPERAQAMESAPMALPRIVLRLISDALVGVLFRSRKRYPLWQSYYCEHMSRWARRLGNNVTLLMDRSA
ncbi:glycosyltransferase family 2 protein [Verrucomicrobiota bacterium]